MNDNNGNVERQLRKQTGLLRAQVFLRVVILLIVLAAGCFLAREAQRLDRCLTAAEEKLETLDMETLNAAVESVSAAAERLRELDAETVDRFSTALQSSADSMREMDLEKIDALIRGLDSAAGKLDSAVSEFKGMFK